MIQNLDDWLYHWADWTRRNQGEALGYPKQTIEYELHRMGGVLIKGEGGPPRITMDQDVTDAMDALQELQRVKINYWYVIRTHYYDPRGLTDKAKAGIAGVWVGRPLNESAYKRILREARIWLEAWRAGKACIDRSKMLKGR